ncbi:type II toxin-antitoxin system VapC family toxin [Spirosoma spitsbergense]|uniref:type II toxin-antitoxin system VapC family toxin n=1 Tax=Spirosoma spitsbergense TaxID=431554 RepID=UPI0003771AE0|nr:PIN domain-containing protein [Spirosoma spitsbergense]
MRTGFKSAFFDTAPFIYLIEGHIQFAPIVRDIFVYCQSHSVQLTTSVLTTLEFKTKPLRNNRTDVVNAFDSLLADLQIMIVPITTQVVEKALDLQTQLHSLKAIDSMQLGAASFYQCDAIITNDNRLTQLNQLQIITLDQWK